MPRLALLCLQIGSFAYSPDLALKRNPLFNASLNRLDDVVRALHSAGFVLSQTDQTALDHFRRGGTKEEPIVLSDPES